MERGGRGGEGRKGRGGEAGERRGGEVGERREKSVPIVPVLRNDHCRVVRKPDLRSACREFNCRLQPSASCIHTCASVTKQQQARNKHFTASSMKDLFHNVAARNIINFIKESHFYSTV